MAVAGLVVYARWTNRETLSGMRRYVAPAIVGVLFVLFMLIDHPQLPGI